MYLTALALEALRDVPTHRGRAARVCRLPRASGSCGELNARVFADVRRREKPRHAMRDTVATGLAAAGVAVEDVPRVLNHAVGLRVTAGYNAYAYDKEKRLALAKWARRLAAILEGRRCLAKWWRSGASHEHGIHRHR